MKIIKTILLISFVLFGMGISIQKIEAKLTEDQIKNYVPYIDAEDYELVNKISDNHFSIKGHIFAKNPSFPVQLGDQFIVHQEYIEQLPNGFYQMHLDLISTQTWLEGHITSLKYKVVNRAMTIVDVKQTWRSVRDGSCGHFEPDNCAPYKIYHNKYSVTLEDGDVLELSFYPEDINVYPGDRITLFTERPWGPIDHYKNLRGTLYREDGSASFTKFEIHPMDAIYITDEIKHDNERKFTISLIYDYNKLDFSNFGFYPGWSFTSRYDLPEYIKVSDELKAKGYIIGSKPNQKEFVFEDAKGELMLLRNGR